MLEETQALMGATRLASGKVLRLSSRACMLFFHFPDARRSCYLIELVYFSIIFPTRDEDAEKTDAGRVAPISGSVFYQIDRLKSGFEAMGRTVMPRNCALMGATRLASGHFSAASRRVAPIRGSVLS